MAGDLTVGQLRVVLEADSSKFAAAMKDASADTKRLSDTLRKELEGSTRGANAAFKDFIGVNAIKRANDMVGAVKRLSEDQKKLDGVTRLNDDSQRKLNAAVSQAISHYKALGKEAPADMLAIQKATAGAVQATSGMGSALKTSFGTLTASFTAANLITKAVTGVIDLGRAAVASAGQIVDLSKKTGLSIEGVQRLGFVAKQSGGSVEQMADAVFKTGINIQNGSEKTRKAVEALGLSFKDIKAQKPEEQYDALIRALAMVEDQTKRNALGQAVMGKAWANVAASVDGYVEALEKAPIANADAIEATDAAADAIERAWDRAEKAAINAIGNIVIAMEKGLQTPTGIGINAAAQATPFFAGLPIAELLGRGMKPAQSKTFGKDINIGSGVPTQQVEDYVRALKAAQAEVAALTTAQKEQIKAGDKIGKNTQEITDALNEQNAGLDISTTAVELFKDSLKGGGKELDAYKKKIQDAARVLTGAKLQQDVKELADTLKEAGALSKLSGEELFNFAIQADRAAQRGAKLTPEVQAVRDKFLLFRDAIEKTRIELDVLRKTSLQMLAAGGILNNTQAFLQFNRDAEIGRRKDLFNDMAKAGPLPGTMGVTLQNQINRNAAFAVEQTEDWAGALDDVVDAFEDLATIAGPTFSDIARGIGSAIASARLFMDGLEQLNNPKNFADILSGFGSIASSAIQAVQAAIALGRAVHDLATRSESEKAAADIRRSNFDPDLSAVGEDSALAKKIADDVKQLGIDRNLALELNLSEIIDAAGGVDSGNFEKFRNRADELFDDIALGGEVGARALSEIDEVMGQLGQHVTEVGGLWDAEFVRMIGRGRDLASVVELIKGQLDIAGGALNKVVGGFAASLPKNLGTGTEADTKRSQLVAGQQEEFDRLSRIALSTFNAMIANGQSAAQAIAAIGPSIDTLKDAVTDFGFAGNDAFGQLSRWRDLVSANQPLLDQLGGLNDLMMALANVGSLDAQTFADIQAQGLQTFRSLTDAGFTQNEALAQMKPLLETLRKLHKDRGLAIDDETQALIDQAEQQGILAEEQEDTNQVLKDGLSEIIRLLGGEIPNAWKKAADAAKTSMDGVDRDSQGLARRLRDRLGDLDFTVDVGYNISTPDTGYDPPAFAGGGFGNFGTGTLAMLHGKEWVIPHEDMADLIAAYSSSPSLEWSSAGALSGMVSSDLKAGGGETLYLMVDSRVLGEVSARTDSRAASRFGLMRS